MRAIPKERILRVNCAGYGTEAHWNLGRAKSLNNYSAIIVNPISIAHLFDKDPELVRKVEQCLAEGTTTLTIDDDLLLRNLAAEIDSRVLELSDFLTQGGTLVYFLCRPFVIQGPSLALDNYYWLESLAPDQPAERNVRHMSAVSHGRLIEPTEDGLVSEFSPYLQQHGLEWSTLIRTEYLTEGYSVLAEAGARKCIAGQLFIVESSGKVVFLPSPYSPDFDKTLIDCLNSWYTQKEAGPEELEAERIEQQAAIALSAAPAPQAGPVLFDREQADFEPVASAQVETAPADPVEITDDFAVNVDQIVATVSQEAQQFEMEVANRVAQESKKTIGNIDLSIFAQTARQLVQKADPPAKPVDEAAPPPEVEDAPASPPLETVAPAEAPGDDSSSGYDVPPDTIVNQTNQPEPVFEDSASASTGHSLRNVLSHAAPQLPESVMSSSPAPAMQLDSEEVEAPQPVSTASTAASLFGGDADFEDDFAESSSEPTSAELPAFPQSDSGDFGKISAPADTGNSGQTEPENTNSDYVSGLEQPKETSSSSSSDSYVFDVEQEAPLSTSGVLGQAEPEAHTTSSGVFGKIESEPPAMNSGAFPRPQVETPDPAHESEPVYQAPSASPEPEPVYQQPAPVVPEPEPVYPHAPPATVPPPAESTVLQPPNGFMTDFGAAEAVPDNPLPPEPTMAQAAAPISTAGDSPVTNNDNENKSTMDLLRELEKAQQQTAKPPQPAPASTMPAPSGDGASAKPLLNNLFKKDAQEMPPPAGAVPPAVTPPAPPPAHVPPPAAPPQRNTLESLMQPAAESRSGVPQDVLQSMAREDNKFMTNSNVPDWCKQYSFSYLDELKREQGTLASQLQDVQAKLNTVESKISSVEQLKCALLAGEGEALKEACGLVLSRLGWTINHNNASPNEVLLLNVDQPEVLVRIVRSDAHADRSEVAQVSGAAIAFWEKHDIEPKGILIACTWSNVSPHSRNQRDFEDAVAEFAKKKNLCLMTTLQMIGIYRDLELGLVTQETVRRQMLETNGCLQGYAVEAGGMVGARA